MHLGLFRIFYIAENSEATTKLFSKGRTAMWWIPSIKITPQIMKTIVTNNVIK